MGLGLGLCVAMGLGLPARGAPPVSDCAARVDAEPKARASWSCFYAKARKTGEYEAQISAVRDLAAQHEDVPWGWMTLGNLLEDQSKPGAEDALEKGIGLMSDDVEASSEVFARINYANGLRHKGHVDRAKGQLDAAAERATGTEELESIVQLERARFLVFTGGDHHRALALLEDVRPRLFPDGRYQARVVWLNTAEVAHSRLGHAERALAMVDELRTLAATEGDAYVQSSAAFNGANAFADVVRTQVAPDLAGYRQRLQEAKSLAVATESLGVVASAACLLAEVGGEDVAELARECLDLLSKIDEPEIIVTGAAGAALGLDAAGVEHARVDAAFAVAEKALAGTPPPGLSLDAELARVTLQARRDPQKGMRMAEAQIAPLRAFLASTDDFMTAAEMSAEWRAVFSDVQGRLIATPDAGEVELARALRLHDATLGMAWDSVMAADERPEPVVDGDPLLWVAQLQGVLAPDEAVLVYALDENASPFPAQPAGGSRVYIVTRNSLHLRALPARHIVAGQARAWRADLSGAGENEDLQHQLGNALFGGAAEVLPEDIRSLIVVPHAEIHELPLPALTIGEPAVAVGRRWEIHRGPSVREIVRWRLTPATEDDRPIQVLAAPDVTDRGLPRLPWARTEAQAIAEIYGERVTVRHGREATESFVKGTAGKRALLHVAAHSRVSGGAPLRSAIELAPDDNDDGRLTVAEIFGQRFDGEIVVLSSCDSSAGAVLPGEGVAGLGQAFFRRGAKAVIATLWPVRDEEAHAMMSDLYAALGRGASVSEALSEARRAALTAGRPPQQWAAYVLVGDGRARLQAPAGAGAPSGPEATAPKASPERAWWPWAAGGAVVLGLGLGFVLFRRRG